MKETVGRILSGKFDYAKGKLDFSCTRIELTLAPAEVYTGSFMILSRPGKLSEGHLYSKDIRMKLINDTFSGTGEEIGYTFSAKGLEEGDVVKGEIYVISNQGEYYLPYVVNISHVQIESSLGHVKNLFHFTNLAKTNWEEAVKLFYSDVFATLFKGNDRQYYKAYLGLCANYGNEQNVEEFLLEINKKHAIEYIADRSLIKVENITSEIQEYVGITRNGWGFTFLNVECDADFVKIPKNTVTDTDFLGNRLKFPIVIDPSEIHGGSSFAKIRFFNAFTSLSVTVQVAIHSVKRTDLAKETEYRRAQTDMVTYYQAFRLKKISTGTWLSETKIIVDRMLLLKPEDRISRMFKAQLLITEDRQNEARWLLDQVENELKAVGDYSSTEWAYFLYLTTLINRDEPYIDSITDEVTNIYNRNCSDWRVAWLLLYLSEEYAISPTKKWIFILEQLSLGCVSPIMYVEAVNVLALNPAFLNKLDKVEQRILKYMMKQDIVNEELVRQFVFLVGTNKWYSETIYEFLEYCYEKFPSKEILSVICALLIDKGISGTRYATWFEKGIEADVRVAKIYEFYVASLDLRRKNALSKMVYLYFSYQCELPWEQKAYIYARVIELRNEMPDIFESYVEAIEGFVLPQITEGHINRDLAIIYRFMLNETVIFREMAVKLSELIFTNRISVDSDQVSKVIVYQNRERIERVYPVVDKVAYVALYNKDYTILFEDNFSNRYMKSVSYDIEKLMVPGKLASMLLPFVEDNISFDVYACECSSQMVEITDENRERYQRILDSDEIEEEYKVEIRSKLMQYYYDNDNIRELDSLLEDLDPQGMSVKERSFYIRYMVIRGLYDKAIDWIMEYGMDGLEPKDLVNLCSRLISRADFVENPEITCVTASIFFKGKYDECILEYLCENFHGMTKDMRTIFKAANDFDIDVFKMCENMILQMLYTGYFVSERMNIYRKYAANGPNTQIQLAFLSQCAYEYFVKEQLVEGYVFEELTKLILQGEQVLPVCKLAYVKFYSENRSLMSEQAQKIVQTFIKDLQKDDIYMSFFREFMDIEADANSQFADKTFIEYKTDPGKKVCIHYIIERDSESGGDYVTEKMRNVFGGVHSKSFVLFFGENLMYYITEEMDGEEQLTESGNITRSDISRDVSTSRFSEVNDIVIARTLQDYGTLDNLIYEYVKKDYFVNNLFKFL